MKSKVYLNKKVWMAVAVSVLGFLYSVSYAVMRYKGEIVAIEEHSSSWTYVHVMLGDSSGMGGQLLNSTLTEKEIKTLIEREISRVRFVNTLFAPAMYLESHVRQIALNLTRDKP